MNIIIISSVVIAGTVVVGLAFAGIFYGFGKLISREQAAVEDEKGRYNVALTMGHQIPVDADLEAQIEEARILAAKQAAAMPRGANLRIGKMGTESQATAFDGIDHDPVSAVKIAHVHGWQLLRTGATAGPVEAAAGTPAPAQTAAPAKSIEDLVPGEDYPFIEITDGMSPAEIRKTRIANAKAKSAAVKALKAAGVPTEVSQVDGGQVQEVTAPAEAPPVAAAQAPAGVGPVPGMDYEVIEITEVMDPADIRSARIANAKAKSAAMKAFKEAGGQVTPPAAQAAPAQPADSAPASQEMAAPDPEIPADIPKPEYIEITDAMDPADIRQARIHNAKAKAAYNKALKAAGIDPSSIST